MLKEFSAGAVVYRICEGKPEFLLVRSRRNSQWGFPKGHIEKNETEIDAAKREIFEETGIADAEFMEGFRKEDVYVIKSALCKTQGKTVEKHSVYFLALALSSEKIYNNEEIDALQWLSLNAASQLLSFENQKQTLKEAFEAIKKYKA
ncbi:MAG: NUDIX domain-containing protein [Endomicrobium sp.]|jgi:8-oxo-dGTP pyrophosphatase MutT (NUDIX family)|nr:NUDIX domain-containing protein [Endomicrobium sp.]